MPTDLSDYLSHPQVLPSFLTESRVDLFSCVSIIEGLTMFPAMLVSMAMVGLMLQDKLGKV